MITTAKPRQITRADILDMEIFSKERLLRRTHVVELKKERRVQVGPDATFYFESYDTMWWQIHEMLYIEKGGEAQIADELAAYNPLIPQGRELVATLMFEIEDAARRKATLARLGGVEHTISLEIEGEAAIGAIPESDVERTNAAGKASSVHFLRFSFTSQQIAAFRDPARRVTLAIHHPEYGHMAVLSRSARQALAGDFA